MELDEVIKSSVKDHVPIPSEFEGIFDIMCDVPFCDKNHFDAESDLMESLLNRDTSIVYSPNINSLLEEFAEGDIRLIEQLLYDDTSSDDDSYEDIDYVEASPPDSELVNLEEVKDDIFREKLLNINLLIAKIESLNDNPSPDCVPKSPSPSPILLSLIRIILYLNSRLLAIKRKRRHADNSLPEYDLFLFETEPDQGELTSVVMEDMLGEHHAHNVLPNHPTLMLDSDFSPSDGPSYLSFSDNLFTRYSSLFAFFLRKSRCCG
ncbi:hypothetical protein Tco_0891110 [Tanacetum coccineum]|uniref:Reverse transcriptase domain-containing protein n=1 Tax=Tanacetum coccineum TaxID=301880 RepID=A0ABQ5C3J0_9ASTR